MKRMMLFGLAALGLLLLRLSGLSATLGAVSTTGAGGRIMRESEIPRTPADDHHTG